MRISEDTGSPTASQPHMSHEQPHTRVSWRRIFTTFSQVHPSLLSLSPALCFTEKQAEMMRTTSARMLEQAAGMGKAGPPVEVALVPQSGQTHWRDTATPC